MGNNDLNGGYKIIGYFSSDSFIKMLVPNPPVYSKEVRLAKYKSIIDRTPDKFLKYHLDWSIKVEEFELAAYIRDTATQRGVALSKVII